MRVGVLAVSHDRTSAALVRRAITEDLSGHAVSRDCIDDVVLVASELVGNAVLHTPATFDAALDVAWDVEPDSVVVRVQDGGDTLPEPRFADDTATRGRGLAIVAAIATDWGVLRGNSGGKQVWARVPISYR